LLRNVVKHAKAKRVVVETLRLDDDSDDGIGLDSEIIRGSKKSRGVGLFIIRELMRDLGGRMEVESSKKGNRITLLVPSVHDQAKED
jgi:signal transduction histidine kinase